jgi:SAM-dependent methyltransferase
MRDPVEVRGGMPDFSQRIGELSPERRKLLGKLLSRQAVPDAPPAPEPEPRPDPLPFGGGELPFSEPDPSADAKVSCRRFYDAVSDQLDTSIFGEFSFFLNYGYVPDLSPQYAAVELSGHLLNRNSVKLVLELIGDCPVDGRRVLDIGCGRGGTVHVLTRFFSPFRVIGLDLSPAAIAFCRRVHRDPRARFHVGDAEHVPFADASFEVVTNLESSSCYPDLFAFYREVRRVLEPGGYFLYSDCLPVERMTDGISFLRSEGFQLERERDITGNVLLSCDEIARARVKAYSEQNQSGDLEAFLGAPGSPYYENMRHGRWTYRILKFRKGEAIA